jgi:chemotaxis regulatin CheY-phosphate phosphatase CheZ
MRFPIEDDANVEAALARDARERLRVIDVDTGCAASRRNRVGAARPHRNLRRTAARRLYVTQHRIPSRTREVPGRVDADSLATPPR